MSAFGSRIQNLRKNKKLTLRELAERSNLSFSFIASLEKGRYNPSRESIHSLAKSLDVEVDELLILSGFLPEESKLKEHHRMNDANNHRFPRESFALENIMDIPTTFQSIDLIETEKRALIAFLTTMMDMKKSQ